MTERIKLSCFSNFPGAEGAPGDVIDVQPLTASLLVGRMAATRVAAPKPAAIEQPPEVAAQAGEGEMDPDGDAEETADTEQRDQPETAARRRARR